MIVYVAEKNMLIHISNTSCYKAFVSPVTTFDLDTEEWEEQDSAPQRTRGPFIKVEL